MNLCGVAEPATETPVGSKALPMPQSRPPPSPLMLSITPSEFQTPRSVKGDALGVTATPSPALLNPLTHEFWNESSSARRAPIFCPRLEPSQNSEQLVQRLRSAFRVKIHDGSCPKGRVVEIRLSEDRSVLHVVDDTMTEETGDEEEEKSRTYESVDSHLLHKIRIEDIVRVEDSGDGFVSQTFPDVDPLKCFSIVTETAYDGCSQFVFECISMKQREAIVSALRAVSYKGEKSLRMRRRSLPSFRGHSSARMQPAPLHLSVTPEAVLSPMKRTCIYADSGSTEGGTELALNRSKEQDTLSNPFSFSEVSKQQSLDEQQDFLEASGSMLAASFQEALDEWCSEDACMDLTEVSESLQGIFFILETQANTDGNHGKHVRTDSSDMQVATLCVTDFLNTPASIWADLPSPIASDEKQDSSSRSHKKLRNRASVANAQAFRWRQLQTEMTFESVDRSDTCLMQTIATTKSLDDLDGTEGRVASSQRIASGNFTDTSGYGLFELFPPGLWGYDTDDPLLENDDCYFYDSEPECSRVLSRRKGPRRIQAERLNKGTAPKTRKQSRLNFSVPRRMGSRFDDEYASAIIDIMKSEQFPLLWHPTPTQARPSRSPLCVTAWVERGTYLLTQAFVQPKFMWRPAQEMNLESKRLNVATESPERVELLEIARVQDTPDIDRKEYPFANKRCFLIQTQSEVHLFEAQSVRDKKRIVFGLKLTISRLASLIMVRDTRAVEEFFEPAQVPGEAPSFAR